MNNLRTLTAAILAAFTLSLPARSENLEHLNQLLATKQCPRCDLSGSGLVTSNLAGAQLQGANLSNANLSQANLSGADLSGANLSGASFYGANLINANLSGAILNGTDLREAYLTNANLIGTNLNSAYVQGAVGIANNAGTPELFYNWGLIETEKGNYNAAIENYNKALALDSQFALAYLGRSYVLFRLGNERGATADAKIASELFQKEDNSEGYETSQNLLKTLEVIEEARAKKRGNPQLDNMVRGVGSMLLQFLPYLF